MKSEVQISEPNLIPEIYSAISLVFDRDTNIISVISELNKYGIYDIKTRRPRNELTICLDLAVIRNEYFWELNDALTKMFSKVENSIGEIKNIATKYHGEIYIDIAFYQRGTFPALVIRGENMRNICFLEANISIDPL